MYNCDESDETSEKDEDGKSVESDETSQKDENGNSGEESDETSKSKEKRILKSKIEELKKN